MIVYPAIDLRGGRVVRLQEGRPDAETVFSDDPVQTAQQWLDQGATWLHMVNLDGAFSQANDSLRILEAVAKLAGLRVQFGGGLRRSEDIQRAVDQGASRVVLGTLALQQPQVVIEAVQHYGADAVCVALDARDGKITTHGWQSVSDASPVSLGQQMAAQGVRHALYTDVSRDGKLSGVDIDGTVHLGRETGLGVIASGGLAALDEITALKANGVVAGAVIGMALYQGHFTLRDALQIAANSEG